MIASDESLCRVCSSDQLKFWRNLRHPESSPCNPVKSVLIFATSNEECGPHRSLKY